jgi:GntR family transcriptional regulator
MSIRLINPLDIVPKYFQLVNILRHNIEDGEWVPYQPIPSERELEKLYHVSRTTVREAIGILIRQGYLYREQGRGTFVSHQKLQKGMNELTSFTEDMLNRGITPGQIILSMEFVKPPILVAQHLEIMQEQAQVYKIERVRTGNGEPIALQTSYLRLDKDKYITRAELEQTGSLYLLLQEKFSIIPNEAEDTIEATLASTREAALLQTAEGSPLLLSTRTMWTQNHHPFEYVKILYRGDRYRYFARLNRSV